MQSEENLKSILLDKYLVEKPKDVKIKNEMLWLYLRIVAMTYEVIEKNGVDKVKKAFLDLFKEDIIFFDKKEQVQTIIDKGVFDTVFETNVKLNQNIRLEPVEEEPEATDLPTKLQEMVDDTKEHVEDIIENVQEVIENVEDITETIKTSSFCDKLKSNWKKVQGYLSHCFGGGKTKD